MTRGVRPTVHDDGLDVAVLVREQNGTWRRPDDKTVPRFRHLEDAVKWCQGPGAQQLTGRRVAIVRILDMFLIDLQVNPVIRLVRREDALQNGAPPTDPAEREPTEPRT